MAGERIIHGGASPQEITLLKMEMDNREENPQIFLSSNQKDVEG